MRHVKRENKRKHHIEANDMTSITKPLQLLHMRFVWPSECYDYVKKTVCLGDRRLIFLSTHRCYLLIQRMKPLSLSLIT